MNLYLVRIKGGWEIDESIQEAASRETVEEAGVVGDVEVCSLPFLTSILVPIVKSEE